MISPERIAEITALAEGLQINDCKLSGRKLEDAADALCRAAATTLTELLAEREAMVARGAELEGAVVAVVDAIRDYLPPDGIDAQECLNRIIGAIDNPIINHIIAEIENGPA